MHRSTRTDRTRRASTATGALCALALLLGACAGDDGEDLGIDSDITQPDPTVGAESETEDGTEEPAPTEELAWPGDEWDTVTPSDAGFDPVALDELVATAQAANSNCLVITHEGRLVGEWYWNDTDAATAQEVFSVTKSISSAVVGIAADQGLLDIDDPVADYVPEWRDTPSEEVTIRNLLSNDSGRYHDFETDYLVLATSDDQTGFAISLDQQHDPGTEWMYNNAAIQVLDAVLVAATGEPTTEFAARELFAPLAMDDSVLKTDAGGNTLTYMGADTTCSDLARFGLLFLRDGSWEDDQVLSSSWVQESVVPSQDLNEAYGFLWWLNRGGLLANPDGAGERSGDLSPEAGTSTYSALGLGNQVLTVFPDHGLVVAKLERFGGRAPDAPQFTVAQLGSGIMGALEDSRPAAER